MTMSLWATNSRNRAIPWRDLISRSTLRISGLILRKKGAWLMSVPP